MVGVVVREQLYVDPSDGDVELVEADRCAAAGINQKFLVASLDERARAEVVRLDRAAGPMSRGNRD
jgi:hypothetical protein